MAVERLTGADEIMLWADRAWPQDIGALGILDGRELLDGGGRFKVEAVLEAVASRLHLVPRLRQLVLVPPAGLGAPLWADDPDFDLRKHVGVVEVPPPGGETELLGAVERLRRRRLDASRPMWEMWFLTGLPHGRVGMFARTHHAIADGLAGVATLGAFLDVSPDIVPVPPEPWAPRTAPGERELLEDERARRHRARRRTLSALAHPIGMARRAAEAWPALSELFLETEAAPISLDRVLGPYRRFALVRASLETVKQVAHANGAKVNDVLLAVIAGGLRSLLRGRGEAVREPVRIYVPVSLRHGEYAGARGNEVAQMVVPLPVAMTDPEERLRLIAAETAMRKARPRPSVGRLPTHGIAARLMIKLIARQGVHVESADLPGPPMPLYLAGARLLELFPLIPLIGRVTVGVGALSYGGHLYIAVVADRDTCPDIEVLAAGIEHAMRELEEGSAARKPLNPAVVSG
jgi:WS/DGAT/MGAT family acyltransferase